MQINISNFQCMRFPMIMLLQIFIVALCLASGQKVAAFTPAECRWPGRSELHLQKEHDDNRRSFLVQHIILPSIATVSSSIISFQPQPAFAADVLLMDKSSPDIPPFKGDVADAKSRFKLAIKDIDNLLANYDEISRSGGDNVRLYLGTQGVKSHMYGISKVLTKYLREEVDDIVEFTEALNEFDAYLYQAEGAAYQSMFVEHSSAKGSPQSFLQTAKGDIVNMRRFMGDLALQLGIDDA